jgi:rhodanese-related sulfurtransferase/TusA-related sulfurtransferase
LEWSNRVIFFRRIYTPWGMYSEGVMKMIKTNLIVDTKGLSCPMPVVKTKRAMNEVNEGQVLEVQATDKGSKADLKAWAQNSGHQYLGLIEENGVFKHFIRKAANDEVVEKKHPHTIDIGDFAIKIREDDSIVILDVREEAEYAFSHIPNAVSIPLGVLEDRVNELNQDKEIYVICRSGSRSDLAAQLLTKKGFAKVINVIPGMSEFSGETTSITG